LLCALALYVVRGRGFFRRFVVNVNERCTGFDRFKRGGERQTHTMKTRIDRLRTHPQARDLDQAILDAIDYLLDILEAEHDG